MCLIYIQNKSSKRRSKDFYADAISANLLTKSSLEQNNNSTASNSDRLNAALGRTNTLIYLSLKCVVDTGIALISLILLLPAIIVISAAIKLEDGGPVFFKQLRTGKNGKNFYIYKFRSMAISNDVHDFKKGDQVTHIGKILRKTSLDEIPQLFCILTQKMAIIGPRPWITDYYKLMNEDQRHRNDVRPGLTGLAQCSGRNNLSIFDKINYDKEYIKNYSLRQDLKIIRMTIKSVLDGTGIGNGKQTVEQELKALKTSNQSR